MKSVRIAGLMLLLAGVLATASSGQSEGKYLSDPGLEGFSGTEAKSLDDFVGRALLIEFFAFW